MPICTAARRLVEFLAEIVAVCRRQTGGFSVLVNFLKGDAIENATLVARAVRTIRHLANDSAATRKALRQAGATEQLIPLVAHGEESSISVDAIAAIGYLAHHDTQTKATVRKMGGIPLLVRMMHAGSERIVAIDRRCRR